tara:strand:- start:10008 stop:10523 length:516 start_codon:yes stop_codon:yes gene_type:complete
MEKNKPCAIKWLISDVDGTLTDGMYHQSDNGVLTKSFYTRDVWAIELLLKNGIKVGLVTQAKDCCIIEKTESFRRKYPFNFTVHKGIEDKKQIIDSKLRGKDFGWESVAYIGDAENDIECLKAAKLSGCPRDAVPILREEEYYICESKGGCGAVYEFALWILHWNSLKQEE